VVDWVRRFGDIPGVTYRPPSGVDGKRLPRHEAVPEIYVFEFDGKRHESLWWPADGSGGSASPAKSRASGALDAPTRDLLRNVYEGLELPGEPSDYHFLIQGCADELWGRRGREPEVLEDVETLCWLDVQLIEACPDAIRNDSSDEPKFFNVLTFWILIDLYEREGFLHEALDVAERAARYGQGLEACDRLAERIAAVENEDRG
jgi:hypothetical protein